MLNNVMSKHALLNMEDFFMQNNQLPTKSHVKLEDYFIHFFQHFNYGTPMVIVTWCSQ